MSGVWLVVGILGVMALSVSAWWALSLGAPAEPDTDEHLIVVDGRPELAEAAQLPRSRAAEAIDSIGEIPEPEWWRRGVLWHDSESRPVAPPRFYDQERKFV